MKYNLNDIEDYLDGYFTGDAKELELFIQQNPEAKTAMAMYKGMYTLIKAEQKPQLSFSLADRVLSHLQTRKDKKERIEFRLTNLLLAAVIVIAVGLSVVFLPAFDVSTYLLSAICVIVIFTISWMFYKTELKQKERIFSCS